MEDGSPQPSIAGDSPVARPGDGRFPFSLLVVDGDPAVRERLRTRLSGEFARVDVAEDPGLADSLLGQRPYHLLVLGASLPGGGELELLREVRRRDAPPEVIVVTEEGDLDTCVQAMRAGAADCLETPVTGNELQKSVHRALGSDFQRSTPEASPTPGAEPDGVRSPWLVGESPALHHLCRTLHQVAPTPSTLLVHGPTGTGKELVGQLAHEWSDRRGAFVPVNCGAVTPDLAESEFFGHAKGAFTGASQPRQGLFRYAEGGTLFLDEVSEMSPEIQAKLLRVLEEGTIRPVGAHREVRVDVRLVAATNRDLAEEVARGRFRSDLFYRLNVLNLRVPPLRERPEDIPPLARHFAETVARAAGHSPPALSTRCLARLQAHPWPGNVRELRHVIERATLLGSPPEECIGEDEVVAEPGPSADEAGYSLDLPLREVERRHALRVLALCGGNKSEAARRLEIGRKTLERKLVQWESRGGGGAFLRGR